MVGVGTGLGTELGLKGNKPYMKLDYLTTSVSVGPLQFEASAAEVCAWPRVHIRFCSSFGSCR